MDHLELLKKGALAEKREHFRDLLIRIDRLIQAIQLNTFRIHDEDLDSIKEDHVLAAAAEFGLGSEAGQETEGGAGGLSLGNLKEHSYLNQAERLFVHEGVPPWRRSPPGFSGPYHIIRLAE